MDVAMLTFGDRYEQSILNSLPTSRKRTRTLKTMSRKHHSQQYVPPEISTAPSIAHPL